MDLDFLFKFSSSIAEQLKEKSFKVKYPVKYNHSARFRPFP